MNSLVKLFKINRNEVDTSEREAPKPTRLTYAVGDIHGRLDMLDRMLDRIEADRKGRDTDLVFLGDYVDRGPDSRGVLRRLKSLQDELPQRVTCLLGNHDRMMLDYIREPTGSAQNWLAVGGFETLASFGVGFQAGGDMAELQSATLREAVGEALLTWLGTRPLWWKSGTLVAVHALTDPECSMDAQSEATLLWARPGRRPVPRRDGTWVVHGHTVVKTPVVARRHIAVDTGAWRGGKLSAAVVGEGPVRFLSVN